jgi:hypothetical protein
MLVLDGDCVFGDIIVMGVYHVDISSGSMPNRIHNVDCRSAAASLEKQFESLSQPCSRKWSICDWVSWWLCSAMAA